MINDPTRDKTHIYHTRGKHTNHYTTDVVQVNGDMMKYQLCKEPSNAQSASHIQSGFSHVCSTGNEENAFIHIPIRFYVNKFDGDQYTKLLYTGPSNEGDGKLRNEMKRK